MTYAEQFSNAAFAAHYQTVSALYYELAAAVARFNDVEAGSRQRCVAWPKTAAPTSTATLGCGWTSNWTTATARTRA